MNIYKGRIVYVLVLLFLIVSLVSGDKGGKWLLSINKKNVLGIDGFKKDFRAFIDMQSITQVVVDDESLKRAEQDKQNRRAYLDNVINDLLIMEYGKGKKIYSEKEIKRRLASMLKVLRRQMVRKYYVDKVIIPKIGKVSEDVVKTYYEEIKKSKEGKRLSALEIRDAARKRARVEAIQRLFLKEIDKLRSRYRIQLNEEYENMFE